MLRILFLAPQPFFEVRGTPLAVLAMVRALTALGHRVDLLTYPRGEDVFVPGLVHRRSLRLPVGHVRPGPSLAKIVLDLPFMAEAWWRMATGGYDVVHAVEEAAHLAAPMARLLGLPLVVDIDSSIPDQLRHSGFAARGPLPWAAAVLERHALRHSAAVITVCGSLTEGVRARAPRARVFQVEDPPLIDTAPPPEAGPATALRRSLGIGAGPVVLYSGNLEPYQGVDLLLGAAAEVPEAWFLFMGGEPSEVEALKARAAGMGTATRCVFAGKRPPSELGTFLALADVLISPRIRGENTPFKLYTYLASGRPLVATRLPTHTQLLDDSLAFLVEATPAGLAGGIRAALADPAAAAERAARGLALIEKEYCPRRFAEKVARAYAEVGLAVGYNRRVMDPSMRAKDPAAPCHRVLVVDDNLDSAETMAEMLKLWGHDVRMAHDGPGALEAARAYRPEAVLLDLGLPVMDGYETARRLREEGLAGKVLVAVTGFGGDEERRRAEEAGFDTHLTKPVSPEALREVLLRCQGKA